MLPQLPGAHHESLALLASLAGFAFTTPLLAADLAIEPAVPAMDASGDWSGPFVGAFGAYLSGEVVEEDDPIEGWLAGVTAGYNVVLSDLIVAGVVGDLALSQVQNSGSEVDWNWTGSLRGRIGVDAGSILPYLTAGLAVANAEIVGFENTAVGWTAGAGAEFAVADDVAVDVQYRYSDYGAEDFDVGDYSFTAHQVSAGLNWRF